MASLNPHQFRTYYHGTGAHNVESIKEHGLKAHNPAAESDYPEGYEDPGHPTGVYLTENLNTAKEYGDEVFSTELPDSAPWGWTESHGAVLKHDIHPYMLKHVKE